MKAIKLFSAILLISIMSCSDDNPYDSVKGYDQTMQDYMAAKGWTGQPTVDGLYYVIDEPGSSVKPLSTATVEVNYRGYYSDDAEFDSGNNVRFNLQGVIEGWTIGIPKFGKGGKGHLLIPPRLGYGEFPNNGTRNQSVLIFDVELLDF